jgi:hypothetical protein
MKVYLPIQRGKKRKKIFLILIPLTLLLVSGIWKFLRTEEPLAIEEEKAVEMQEVEVEAPPPPPPEPELAEPQDLADPEIENPFPENLLQESDALPNGPKISLDLALGTGEGGLGVAGSGGGGSGGGQGRYVYQPGQTDKAPELPNAEPPDMPRKATESGVGGRFTATFVVSPKGRVEDIRLQGTPTGYGFEESIRKSLSRRRYRPAEAGGVPVPVKMSQEFVFSVE